MSGTASQPQIDWAFIGSLEGQSILTAYVPDPQTSQSGVTLATGVDLGQLTHGELARMGLDPALCARLEPYVGLRRQAAVDLLTDCPLAITQAESDALDAADRAMEIAPLITYYDWATEPGAFVALSSAAQTVLASVAFQYGANLRRKTPRFWADAVRQDWQAMVNELWEFGDSYPTRRRKEALYLAGTLGLELPTGT